MRRFAVSHVTDMICVGCSCCDIASILTLAQVYTSLTYEKAEPNVASCASLYISTFEVKQICRFCFIFNYLIGSGAKLDTVTDEEPRKPQEEITESNEQ